MSPDGDGLKHQLHAAVQRILASRDPAELLGTIQSVRQVIAARFYLRHCSSVGTFTRLTGRPRISNRGTLIIGAYVRLYSTTVPIELATQPGGTLEIGDRCSLNYGDSISAHQSIRLGRLCRLGTYVNIMDNNWHDIHDRSKVPPSAPVTLEENVWLGNSVIVLPGVTIGRDAVVGAGSVVMTDIPPRSVAMGNPARVVRSF